MSGDVFGAGFSGLNERAQIRRAANELEAVVIAQLLGSMRKTVPESGLFEKSARTEIFRSMLDQEIARATAQKSPFGLADAIEKSLEGRFKDEDPDTDGQDRFRRVG